MRQGTLVRLSALLAASALATSGCLQQEGGTTDAGDTEPGDGSVTITGAFPDPEAGFFEEALKPFEEQSGIDVTYEPATDFTTEIRTSMQAGDPPDIALFPQPGLVLELADTGDALPLDDVINLEDRQETLIPGFLDAVTTEEGTFAAPMRMAVKSVVWYPKPEFEEAGYEVPQTWTELMDLAEQMKADGNTPWCLGAESGADTGWVYTDWMEELVLRTGGPEVYDQWVNHEIPFDDEAIQRAGDMFGDIIFSEGYVLGGAQGTLNTSWDTAPNPLFQDPPGCFLHRQGNFITASFPKDVQKDLAANVGTFVLPPVEDGFDGQPILGAGDMAAMFVNDEDVVKTMEFLTSDEFGGPWAEAGGYLSPHRTFDNTVYPDEITQQIAGLAQEADVFRFDGSDLMPAQVGAGTFWDEMVAWVSGEKDLGAALTEIEDSWPSS